MWEFSWPGWGIVSNKWNSLQRVERCLLLKVQVSPTTRPANNSKKKPSNDKIYVSCVYHKIQQGRMKSLEYSRQTYGFNGFRMPLWLWSIQDEKSNNNILNVPWIYPTFNQMSVLMFFLNVHFQCIYRPLFRYRK